MQPAFIHLHTHSEFSIADGLIQIDPLIERCVDLEMPAVALTDRCNFFGVVKFYQKAFAAGVKSIIGTDVFLTNEEQPDHPWQLTLLCQNQIGYKNAITLVSKAYIDGQQLGVPSIKPAWLWELSEGLIVLSGGKSGELGAALLSEQSEIAEKFLAQWLPHFSERFYVEIQRTGRKLETQYNQAAIEFAACHGLPVVATNDVRFLAKEDFEAHEVRVCINAGEILADENRVRHYSEEQYLRSAIEMQELFSDIPEALTNTIEIAKRCNVELTLKKIFLPKFPINGDLTLDEFFAKESIAGLTQRPVPGEEQKLYQQRLEHEIKVIQEMGFAGYFLIVADFIKWAKEHDIPVGPGRGSGAGSLVAYALHITDLDPIVHKLLFERFLNPERVSMPDFDIDFCMIGRDRVIEYVTQKYGSDKVAQIITFGTLAAKAVIRDVGRVLGLPYGYVDKVAKLVPLELGITLEQALEQEVRLLEMYKNDEDIKILIDLALKLEGLTRNAGKHAGGLVIAPTALTDFTPLYCEPSGTGLITQFDKGDVETIGLVKFDFLGLRTLTIIHQAVVAANAKLKEQGQALIDINALPLNDKKVYALLKSDAIIAVFQFDASRGTRDLVKRLQPDNFDDIVALGALCRPGPSGMAPDYIERKQGRATVTYLHPSLRAILAETYGIILYQEQVMQIAQVLAGYSLGSADLLRRAMGKKKPEEMAKQREIFVRGAIANKVDKRVAEHIFDLMEKFSGYGFNKSHSAAYALISYQTAWLKAHYPAEFMAAVLSSDMDRTEKMAVFIDESRRMKLHIVNPHVNHSEYMFVVNKAGHIVYGLGALKGVGQSAAEHIAYERNSNGQFTSMLNFLQRVDIHKVNKRALEALIKGGALDDLGQDRATLMANLPALLQMVAANQEIQKSGQLSLFAESDEPIYEYTVTQAWSKDAALAAEREILGVYLSGHPLDMHQEELAKITTANVAELGKSNKKSVIIAGLLIGIKTLRTKTDKRMAVLTLEDKTGRVEVTVFNELYQEAEDLLVKDKVLVLEGEINFDTYTDSHRLQAKRILELAQARCAYTKCIYLKIKEALLSEDNNLQKELFAALSKHRGGNCHVYISYATKDGLISDLKLGEEWRVLVTDELLHQLTELVQDVVLLYQ